MKSKNIRLIVPAAVLVVAAVCFAAHQSMGTLSGFGWGDIVLLCPLGALGTMIAAKLVIPRAVVSLALALLVVLLVGRAFCAWICPVPLVQRLRDAFAPKKKRTARGGLPRTADAVDATQESQGKGAAAPSCEEASGGRAVAAPLTDEERALLSAGCGKGAHGASALDSRHFVLGGVLLSTAVFGFPVFCLVCPIGLSFASIFLVMRLFGAGDVTWAVVLVPALLVVEVVFLRKWCHRFCPLSALMSLVAKANRTFRPKADARACIEHDGRECGRCAAVCPEGIDPRHPQAGASLSECTRCRACVDACPGKAISLPLLAGSAKRGGGSDGEAVAASAERVVAGETRCADGTCGLDGACCPDGADVSGKGAR